MSYYTKTGVTEQDVERLIDGSKAQTDVSRTDYDEGLADALYRECDGTADTGDEVEFWGVDLDGKEWRVHLTREVRS